MDERCIILDVGGRIFKTRLKTLNAVSGSYFSQLLTANNGHPPSSDGYVFIDRDADAFPTILGYLRHGINYPLPDDDCYKLSRIAYEAQFYKLPELAKCAERARIYANLNFMSPKMALTKSHSSLERSKNRATATAAAPVLSIRRAIIPIQFQRYIQIHFKRSANFWIFRHVVHIGWAEDGQRIVVDRSGSEQKTLKSIVRAVCAEISQQPVILYYSEILVYIVFRYVLHIQLVYSMVDADEEEGRSESVEVFFAGSTIRALDSKCNSNSSSNLKTALYDNCMYEVVNSQNNNNLYSKPVKKCPIVTDM
ncbi:unnamed protein product [Gongylonema pulchrum]|uniref:BTB domain-containing protein n=1 Tax=Gongylonema pulchrum TaxID=637853 RepID=A0A183E230_9BILA|nr:unnamed protein product [Gongylonema pulchrum]